MNGRPPDADDRRLVDELVRRWDGAGRDFKALLVETVTDPRFAERREEVSP